MPVSYNSPARNFFLLASTGGGEVTSFIRRITTPSPSDTFGYEPASVEYVISDQKFLVSGTQYDAQDDQLPEGYLVKTTEDDTRDFDLKIQSTIVSTDYGTTIRSIAQDSNENIIICGRRGIRTNSIASTPYVGKFDLNGNSLWFAATTHDTVNQRIEYTDIAIDANDNIFVIGYDSENGTDGTIISRYTPDGAIVWSVKVQDTGSDGFVDIRGLSISVNDRDELVIAGSLEGITREKGFVGKYDLNGNQIWLKTFEDKELGISSSYRQVVFNSAHVDGNGYIYCAGYSEDTISLEYRAVVLRLDPLGNLVWQNKTNYINSITYTSVSADTLTGQAVVAGEVWTGSEGFTVIQRFNAAGKLTWSRKLSSTNARSRFVNVTSDPSYYYITYADETQLGSDPESFLYGKLSITGNGLGTFAYADGVLDQNYVVVNIPVKTGTLFDGSIRNDASDFVTYPHSATKILFDDLTMIYQPKMPVHDGSDHDITTENVLSEPPLTITASTDTTVIDTSSFYNVIVAPNGTGTGSLGGFAIGEHLRFGYLTSTSQISNTAWTGSNDITTTSARVFDTFALDLRKRSTITLSLIRGNSSNGGETPDGSESFNWWWSIDGKSTWVAGGVIISPTSAYTTLNTATITLPLNAKTEETYLRFGQPQSSGYNFDHYGLTQFVFDTTTITDPEAPNISADGIVYDSNLLLNYDFNNLATYPGTGTTFENLSSSSYSGTLDGATFVNNYIDTGSSTGRLVVTDDGGLQEGNNFSYEAWVWYDNTTQTNSFPRIYERSASLMHFTQDPANTDVYFNINTASGTRQVAVTTGSNVPAPNTWNHYVGTYDGQNQILYINGVEAANTNHGSVVSPNTVTNDLYIGDNGTGGGRIMDGRIGEFRRYTRTLSSTEVSQNFNATRAKYGV